MLATLDVLLAFADAASTYGYVRPEMREVWEEGAGAIDVRGGRCVLFLFSVLCFCLFLVWDVDMTDEYMRWCRHPLQEQVLDMFVANDAYVVSGQHQVDNHSSPPLPSDRVTTSSVRGRRDRSTDREEEGRKERCSVVIVTGANACGKSVYLKQVRTSSFFLLGLRYLRGRTDDSACYLDRFDTIHGTSTVFPSFSVQLLYSPSLGASPLRSAGKPRPARISPTFVQAEITDRIMSILARLLYFLLITDLMDDLISDLFGSFVPAESATLGIVDKSTSLLLGPPYPLLSWWYLLLRPGEGRSDRYPFF